MPKVELRFIGPLPLIHIFAIELIKGELGKDGSSTRPVGASVNVEGAELTISRLDSVVEKRAFPPEVEKVMLDVVIGLTTALASGVASAAIYDYIKSRWGKRPAIHLMYEYEEHHYEDGTLKKVISKLDVKQK